MIGSNSTDDVSNATSIEVPSNHYEIFRIAAPELLVADRLITPIFYFIGAIGNPLSANIWLSKKVRRSNSSAIYLGAIAIVDAVFLFLHVWKELLQAWGLKTFNRPIMCEIYMVCFITPQYLAPILILGFTFERFIAICFPFFKERYCTVRKAVVCVFVLTSLALGLGSFQAYFWAYTAESEVCTIRIQTLYFYTIWTWTSEMLIFLVVPLAVLVFNILVIREIKKINQFPTPKGQDCGRSSNHTSTVTLLSVSFYLICTLLPATIVYAMQLSIKEGDIQTPPADWSKDDTWTSYLTYYHIRAIVEEICLSNYACYVFIYYITSAHFRDEVHQLWFLRHLSICQDGTEKEETKGHTTIVNVKGQTVLVDNNEHA